MNAERRIIPVSSGKGGVGKTTVALNYALSLSRHGRTILVDLDTGTSSVRNCLDTPVERDLYHFFKKGHRLDDCVTSLGAKLDPRGEYANFGFVAGPKHMIEDITNFNRERREQLIDAINGLQAQFIVLDLKSGLDSNVVEFLPYTNSGILVFTPHLPSATLAASDIVKAILFRKLRMIFGQGSPIYLGLRGIDHRFVNSLIDRVEDVYDDSLHNLDDFVVDLQHALGEDHPVVNLVTGAVDTFVVHYVLNMFNGVRESYETAVKPFVQNLVENVSAHMTILNLGWVIAHQDINQANHRRVPVLLARPPKPAAPAKDAAAAELEQLASQYLGVKPPPPRKLHAPNDPHQTASATRYLDAQLDTLKRMYGDMKGAGYRENIQYIVHRSLHVMTRRGIRDFGDTRLFKRLEFQALLGRKDAPQQA